MFPFHPTISDFDPFLSFGEQDVVNLAEWGFNAVRLGVMWPGVEPMKGEYNETYLNIMEKIVSFMSSQNIFALIEMHQDL